MMAGRRCRVAPAMALLVVVASPAEATESRLGALGFERPLGDRELLRTWHRQTRMGVDGARDAGQRTAPQIRRITSQKASDVARSRPKPLTGTTAKRRDRYASAIDTEARRHGVDPDLVHAVIRAESAYNPKARSHAGACGLMQLMPATARRFGVRDIWEPAQNIRGGVTYLRFLLDRFGGDIRLVLAAYNAGEGAVAKYGNRIPPYRETRTYVRRVLGYLGSV